MNIIKDVCDCRMGNVWRTNRSSESRIFHTVLYSQFFQLFASFILNIVYLKFEIQSMQLKEWNIKGMFT